MTSFRNCLIFILLLAAGTYAQAPAPAFKTYEIKGVGSISIPDLMMLQTGSAIASPTETIFQQKPAAEIKISSYARVMIDTEAATPGTYRKLTTKLVVPAEQLRQLDAQSRADITKGFEGTGLRIVRWDGISVVTVNGRSAIKTAYLRQLNQNPPVYAELYQFFNNDRLHTLTISYREQDASVWKAALARARDSFTITNIR